MQAEDCHRLFGQVERAARSLGVRDIEAIVSLESQALTRFANNAIHQNVAEREAQLSVRPLIEGRTARASTNRLDADSIRRVVEEAVAITRLTAPDPTLPSLAAPAASVPLHRYFEDTAQATPRDRAETVAQAIEIVEAAGQTAAGIFSTGESMFALLNSRGVFARHAETMARFSITAMASTSSGWAKASHANHAAFDPCALARSAAQKAAQSAEPRELAPGRYTVILEPAAVLDLTGQMFPDFSATAVRDGRSFLSGRIGTRLFGENITILDDAAHPLQSGPPFDGEGVPRRPLTLVDRGVVREIAYSRQAAALAAVEPTGHGYPLPNDVGEAPANIVILGGATPVDRMVAASPGAILVTRLWYIREVDPYEKIFTGMTRDGTFLIEDGGIACGLRNFRFNESLIEMLSRVESLSEPVRASGEEAPDLVCPALQVSGFRFTEVTRF